MLAILAWRMDRLRRVLLLALGAMVVAGAFGVAAQPGPVWANAYGPGTGITMNYAPSLFEARPVAVITAGPGRPYAVVLNVTNPGRLPMRLLGVVELASPSAPLAWTAVGLEASEAANGGLAGIDSAHPFEPLDLQPGGFVALYLAGRASSCAAGDGVSDSGSYVTRDTVDVAYQLLGLTRVAEVQLPFVVTEPQSAGCSLRIRTEDVLTPQG